MPDVLQAGLLTVMGLTFTFMNGFNDSGSIVATAVSSRALSLRDALALSAAAHLVAP
ncbi:MAG: inorganic phosphate transporter, partial [Candidatus Latescibacterota bacterium]